MIAIELAFLGDPLERLTRALDPILELFAIRRQQFDNAEAAARPKTTEWT